MVQQLLLGKAGEPQGSALAKGHPGHALTHRLPISAAHQFLEVQGWPGELGEFLGLSCVFSSALTQSVCLNCGAEGAPHSQVWALAPACVSEAGELILGPRGPERESRGRVSSAWTQLVGCSG